MKQFVRLFSAALLVSAGLVACEKDMNDPDPTMREEYLGQWQVFESAGQFAPQSYAVEIVPTSAFNGIRIRGLYDYDSLSAEATVSGHYMDIPKQQFLQFSVWGEGQANADFDQITIHFMIQDPAGIDSVKAILTR